jgi:hypothetical protein
MVVIGWICLELLGMAWKRAQKFQVAMTRAETQAAEGNKLQMGVRPGSGSGAQRWLPKVSEGVLASVAFRSLP